MLREDLPPRLSSVGSLATSPTPPRRRARCSLALPSVIVLNAVGYTAWFVWAWWLLPDGSATSGATCTDPLTVGLTALSMIVVMDMFNWLLGFALHHISCLRCLHEIEHRVIKHNELVGLLSLNLVYMIVTFLGMLAWGVAISCTEGGCFHLVSIGWLPTCSYHAFSALARLLHWIVGNSTKRSCLLRLPKNAASYYWAHFMVEGFRGDDGEVAVDEWEAPVLFGTWTPFYDIIFGTCPYRITFSTPIPMLDFICHSGDTFATIRAPREVDWGAIQRVWQATMLVCFVALWVGMANTAYLPWKC